MIEICRLYRGDNNGRIVVPVRWLGERLGTGKSTAARVLSELDDGGFVRCVKFGRFSTKDQLASEYRITFHRCNVSMSPPTRDFMNGPKFVICGPAGGTVAA